MEVLNGSKTLGRARLSFAKQADIDDFVQNLEAFEKGDMASDAWRAFRLLRGTYGQRQEGDLHMMRVKIPQGVLDQPQPLSICLKIHSYHLLLVLLLQSFFHEFSCSMYCHFPNLEFHCCFFL